MIVPLADAVTEHVHDGDVVALEGFTHLIPFAAGHEIIRQGRRDLTLVRMTPDVVYDQLIGMGCARRSSSSAGAATPASARCTGSATRSRTGGRTPLEIEEHSHAGMAARYTAGASGLPFGGAAWLRGQRPGRRAPATIAAVDCPFTGEELAAVPALNPDVTVVHAQRADRAGNVQLWGIVGVQKEAVLAARRGRWSRSRRSSTARAGARRRGAAGVGRGGRVRRARRRPPVVRARLLHPRQRLLPGVGRDQPRPGRVHRVDGRSTSSRPRPPARPADGRAVVDTRDEMMPWPRRAPCAAARRASSGIGLPSTAANLARARPRARPRAHLRVRHDRHEADACCRCRSATASSPTRPTRWSRCPRSSPTGCRAAASTSASSAPPRSTASPTSTPPSIGGYGRPEVRLPGAGGAPEIAAHAGEVLIIVRALAAGLRRARSTSSPRSGFGGGPDQPRRARPARTAARSR